MLVGINYNTDGTRYIALILYDIKNADSTSMINNYRDIFSPSYDELYLVKDFNPNYKPLIQDIVLTGCRL